MKPFLWYFAAGVNALVLAVFIATAFMPDGRLLPARAAPEVAPPHTVLAMAGYMLLNLLAILSALLWERSE